MTCEDCGEDGAGVRLGDSELCDRCADRRIALATGWPELPPAPPAEILIGPDGERRVFHYRLFRWPGRVVAVAQEKTTDGEPGYRLEVGIDHDEDPAELGDRIRRAARVAVASPYLERDEVSGQRQLSRDEIAGYLVETDNPYSSPQVIVDGHPLSWDELGEIVQSYVGWSFQLCLGRDASDASNTGALARTVPVDAPAKSLLRQPPQWYVIDLDHYLTPHEWRRCNRQRK